MEFEGETDSGRRWKAFLIDEHMIPTLSRFIRRFDIRQLVIIFGAFCCFLLLGMSIYRAFEYSGRTVLLEMRTSVPGIGQIFFDSGKGYNERESHSYRILTGSTFIQYVIPIPETAFGYPF
jgi:hypothetical protein